MNNYKIIVLTGFASLFMAIYSPAQHYANTTIPNLLVGQNVFLKRVPDNSIPPAFANIRPKLPIPVWPARKDVIDCYWKTWEMAFSNLHAVSNENRFISPFIDPVFNQHIFMWDMSFMTMFGRYGSRAFHFQGSLDNFYNRQHKDGFICREISELNGDELFEKFDPSSTGPNIMPWTEWDYFIYSNDVKRLQEVFPVLLAYYEWFRTNRSWPDGSYYSSGWGCGMDNQPRQPAGFVPDFSHGFMSWIDITLQQVFAGKLLLKMAKELNREKEVESIITEIDQLTLYLQQKMWDDKTGYFYDRFRDGSLSKVKSIASYWALLAGVVPEHGLKPFIAHLANPAEFARVHRVPTMPADEPAFAADGNYWRGGVWAPTTYMVLRGLTNYQQDSLAHEIGFNHLDNVVKVFNETGILWENYAPDSTKGMYRKNMVGWTGLAPISVLIEYVFGIRSDVPKNIIEWDIRLTDEHGIQQYPFGKNGLVNLHCKKRKNQADTPKISVQSNLSFLLKITWKGGEQIIHVKGTS